MATLRRLLATPGLGIRVLTGHQGLDRPVSWVAVSELPDPTPFLEGGELVLLTGVGLDLTDPGAARAYLERLQARGVAGLGFGSGVVYPRVPAALVEAASAGGLPLLDVDPPTPFIAIGKALGDLLEADRSARAARRLAAMRELTSVVADGAETGLVVRRLAALLGGWAAVLDGQARVLTVAGRGARPDVARALVEQVRGRGAHVSASVLDETGRTVLLALGSARGHGYLAAGTEGAGPGTRGAARASAVNAASAGSVGSAGSAASAGSAGRRGGWEVPELDHQVVTFAAALLALDTAAGRTARELTRWARARALADAAGLATPVPPGSAFGPLSGAGPVRVLALAEPLDRLWARLGEEDRIAAVELPEGGSLLVVDERDLDEVMTALGARAGEGSAPGPRGGLSAAVPLSALPEGVTQARGLAARARTGILRAGEEGWVIQLLGEPAAAAFADTVLGPLRRADPELLPAVRGWLAHHGQVGAAAEALGVHRHTLRERIRRAGQLLARDLDDPQVRAELWIALGVPERGDAAPEQRL